MQINLKKITPPRPSPQGREIRSGISHPPILADTKEGKCRTGNGDEDGDEDEDEDGDGNGDEERKEKRQKKEGFGTKFVGDKRERKRVARRINGKENA